MPFRYGESHTSKSRSVSSAHSINLTLKLNDLENDEDNDGDNEDIIDHQSLVESTQTAYTLSKCYQYKPDYEEKKQRILRGKFAEQVNIPSSLRNL